jgi:hypothetical protein
MSRPPLASQNVDHLLSLNTRSPSAREVLSRRTFLLGATVAALATSTASADVARQRFNRCEEQYFDLCPCLPEALTSDGPLGHLLSWSHWSATDLRRMLKDPERRDIWDEANKALAIAKAYEAAVRRAKRKTKLAAVAAAHNATIDAIGEVGELILAAPAQSLEGLAVKARVIKTWGRREWWDREDGDADTYERLAAQIIDAVAAAAEAQRKGGAG